MKAYPIVTILIFFVFALLQLNDPDPYLWFPLYFIVCVLAGIRIVRPIPKKALYLFALLYLAGAGYFSLQIPYFSFDVEEVRETFGLILAAVFVIGLTVNGEKSIS
jgi:hypothetical protein